jgi:hypothetical protein
LDPIRPIYRRSTPVLAGREMARPNTVNHGSIKHFGLVVAQEKAIYHVRVPNHTVHLLKNKHSDDTICHIEHWRGCTCGPCSHFLLVLWFALWVEVVEIKFIIAVYWPQLQRPLDVTIWLHTDS